MKNTYCFKEAKRTTSLLRWSRFLLLLGILVSFEVTAQTRVVVIPYGRFDFHSDYDLKTIGEYNKIDPNDVYQAYKDSLVSALQRHNKGTTFFIPKQADLDGIQGLVTYEYRKKPLAHYAVNIMELNPAMVQLLTRQYGRSHYVLFINWYKIKKTRYSTLSGASKAKVPYTYHFVDMDLFDVRRNWIGGAAQFEMKMDAPSTKALFFRNLRLKEVRTGYKNFAVALEEWIKTQTKKE